MDRLIPDCFGVSKALLEHVIFCHQEDSDWPLQSDKVLKSHFDEIFSATKYIKALDVLNKQRLAMDDAIKKMSADERVMKMKLSELNKVSAECQRHTAEVERLTKELTQLKEYRTEAAEALTATQQSADERSQLLSLCQQKSTHAQVRAEDVELLYNRLESLYESLSLFFLFFNSRSLFLSHFSHQKRMKS